MNRHRSRVRHLENSPLDSPQPSAEELAERNRSSLERLGPEFCANVLREIEKHAPGTFDHPEAPDGDGEPLVSESFERAVMDELNSPPEGGTQTADNPA